MDDITGNLFSFSCVQHSARFWKCLWHYFGLKQVKASKKTQQELFTKKKNGETERKRALHNLSMPKNISDTLACGSWATFSFYHILTPSVICYWTEPRHYGIYLFNNNRQISLNTRLKLGSFSSHAVSTNLSDFFPFVLLLCFPNALRLAFISDKWIDIGEGLTWQMFQQMWRVLSVAVFPLMMIFSLLVQRKTWSQIYAIRFISVMQACSAITANFVLISWFSRSDEFMKPLLTILSLGCYLL